MGFHPASQTVAQGVVGHAELRPIAVIGEDWLSELAFVLVPFVLAIAGAGLYRRHRPALVITNS